MKVQKNKNGDVAVNITVQRARVKVYNNADIYFNDGQQFEIQFTNGSDKY